MSRAAMWLGAFVTGCIAWLACSEIHWPGRLLVAVLLGPMPVLFMLQSRAVTDLPMPLPRSQVYVGSIVALWLLGIVAFVAGTASGFAPVTMGLTSASAGAYVVATIATTITGAVVVAVFKAAGIKEANVMRELIPVTAQEKLLFVALSISAGICEEIAFRGFLLPALTMATSSIAAGVVISSLAFGVLHAHQHAAGALRAATLGALLAVPLVLTGSIYASMTAHAVIDIAGGLWLARWLLK